MVNRRELLKLIALGVVGHNIDYDIDRLLFVPGERTIFIPPTDSFTYSQIVEIEMRRVANKLSSLFERDALFYKIMENK